MYADLARLWPVISPVEEYEEESEVFARTIKQHARIDTSTLLHLGCGGGHNDHYLKRHFHLTGVDLSRNMLRLARKHNPDVEYRLGDMRTLRLGRQFDAVAILDSIAHMTTVDDLRAAFATARAHLKTGGTFLTLAEELPGEFRQNSTSITSHARGDLEVVLVENSYDPDPTDTSIECTFVYIVRRRSRLSIHTDRFACGLFPVAAWTRLLREVGFRVRQVRFGHSTFPKGITKPLFVCGAA